MGVSDIESNKMITRRAIVYVGIMAALCAFAAFAFWAICMQWRKPCCRLFVKELNEHPVSLGRYDRERFVFRGTVTRDNISLHYKLDKWINTIPTSFPDMNSYVSGVVVATPHIKVNFMHKRVIISIGSTNETTAGHYSWLLRECDLAMRSAIDAEIDRLREDENRTESSEIR